MTPDFWRSRRVFVTGHTGFKGSWLSLWLQQLGATVSGYALAPPTAPSLYEEANVAAGMDSTIHDVRDLAALSAAIATAQPEVLFHLAAQPLVRESYVTPVETYSTNVMGTVNVLEALRHAPCVRAAVIVTSDKCYENREQYQPYVEDDAMGGHDPYSSSKGCAELVTSAMRRSYFASGNTAVASARAGNVIGGGDWATDRLIPDLMRAAHSGIPANIRNPAAIRPWQHVLDPLAGYLLLAEKLHGEGQNRAGAWNFGPDDADSRPVSWVAEQAATRFPGKSLWQTDGATHPHEAKLLMLDSTKARAAFGWRGELALSEAIAWTLDWYQSRAQGANIREATLQQISNYQNRLAA